MFTCLEYNLRSYKTINVSSEEMEERVEQVEKRVKALEGRLYGVENDVELCVCQEELNEGDRKIELFEEQIKALELLVTALYKYIREQRS